jgi:hydroxyacylglutathione hydrolase
MRKSVKWILRGFAVIVSLILIVAVVFLINFLQATKAMTPSETMALNDSVWCIKERFVNAYLFKSNNGYILIDAGMSKKKFNGELKKLSINPDMVKAILLTHTDGDHTGAIPLFKYADVYMHMEEEQMVNGTTGKTAYSKTKWKYGQYKLLKSNDSLSVDGLNIRILHTPGHTPGSSCYIVGNDYLVSGDNLFFSDGRYEHFVERFNMDTPRQIESLKSLPPSGSFKYILTGHNGITKITATK